MSVASRLVPRSVKGILITLVLVLVLGILAWQGLRAWWLHGYSQGTRTGLVRKFSYKGSPLCKYWSGELALQGSSMTNPEVWEFTVDGPSSDSNPIVQAIQKAEASGKPATLRYRQDKGKWWACAPTEYYVTGVVGY
jgi:hypothetical protein